MSIEHYSLLPHLPKELLALADLALDLRWSWSHAADTLWEHAAAELWSLTRNPWLILQSISAERLEQLAADSDFVAMLADFHDSHEKTLAMPSWYEQAYPQPPVRQIAYFSMEFGISEALPIYSGGLGILAGDCLKTASDLGIPMVGLGLLWQQGYFRQVINGNGCQEEVFPFNNPHHLPVLPVRDAKGEWLRVELPFPGRLILLRAWEARIGRARLYLLDSNDPINHPADCGITSELYGGGSEMRLQQEICLGVGGWLLLGKLGIQTEICHLNEGHAAFAVIARARDHAQRHGVDFSSALHATRAGNIFTTHTPVSAGFDRFSPELLRQYSFGIAAETLLALGRENPEDREEPFNMAYLAMRGSILANGVSHLHGQVSRRIFQPLFPGWPQEEVPVTHVTNGVHVPSWDSPAATTTWTKVCGKGRWMGDLEEEEINGLFQDVSDQSLWDLRSQARSRLVTFARDRHLRQLASTGASVEQIKQAEFSLDPNILTIGFARRFTAYKRPNMLLCDPGRLYRLLTHPRYPVQMIIAGKAHPQDDVGKNMIHQWNQFIAGHPDLADKLVFLEDYDMLLAEQMVQGVDLWINTPRRPWEACGTSGMKVLVNGGLNLSELDGWWAEAYTPEVGWAIGDMQEHDSDLAWDTKEANDLYSLLEGEVAPLFYHDRDPQGCPCGWVAMMRESMTRLTPRFSSNRMLREYLERLYMPATCLYAKRQDQAFVDALHDWRVAVERHWNQVHFGELCITEDDDTYLFHLPVYFNDLPPDFVKVELYAIPWDHSKAITHSMQRGEAIGGSINGFHFTVCIPKERPVGDYTPRIIPALEGAIVPTEARQILWYPR